MVLELLISPGKAKRKPWELFFIGAIYSSIALILSNYIFREQVGMVMVFLTTLACFYLVHRVIQNEEKEDQPSYTELSILKEHAKALLVLGFLFLGFLFSFSLWYIALPAETTHHIFSVQERTISCINSGIDGCITGSEATFVRILTNNFKVLLFTLIFAFFYGAGAIFILVWNAAVVGTAIGIWFRKGIATIAGSVGFMGVHNYFAIYTSGVWRYMFHGVFEIAAYLVAALAGGIISIAITRHDFGSAKFRKVLWDSVDLIALALGLLFLGSITEVFITPLFF